MGDSRTVRFDTLVAPHLAMLLRVAYRLTRDRNDAQDLVQDMCIAACENPADVSAANHPQRWLLRVLHNRFIDCARHQKRSPFISIDEADAASPLVYDRPGPEESLQQADAERPLERAYLKLENDQRTLLVLRAEGYDLTEIESITGIAKDVLRARLHRARRSLRARARGGRTSGRHCVIPAFPQAIVWPRWFTTSSSLVRWVGAECIPLAGTPTCWMMVPFRHLSRCCPMRTGNPVRWTRARSGRSPANWHMTAAIPPCLKCWCRA